VTIAYPAQNRPRAHRRRLNVGAGAMLSIATVAVACVVAMVAVVIWLSFVDGLPGDPHLSYSLAHYREILFDAFTYRVFANTLIFSTISLFVSLLFGLPLAWLMERTDFPGKPLVYTLMTVGLLVPGFAVALGWVFLLHPRVGIVNQLLISTFGLREAPINIVNIVGMGMIEGLSLSPVIFIMTAVVFRTMNVSLEEAARMNRATMPQTIWQVTLPLAVPGIVAAGIYVFALGFAAFDIPAVIGLAGRIYTFSTYVFQEMNPNEGIPEYGSVAVLSVLMVFLAVALSLWYSAMQARAPRYAVITGKSYRPSLIPLNKWKSVSISFVCAYFALTQALPILLLIWAAGLPYVQLPSASALAQFSLNNFRSLPFELIWSGLRNTFTLMILVPTITLAASVAVSWVVLRSNFRFRRVFDFLAFLPHTIPAIVFSVAAWLLALFFLRDIVPIYGTVWILVLVYSIVRLSYGTRMTNSALIQIHRELDESALMSGAGVFGVLRHIIVPLLLPTLLYSWIWIALLAYRELTLPVVLSTAQNQPLSVVVWSLVATSSYGAASAVALLMLIIMIPLLYIYWLLARRVQRIGDM
jgi:iron(III) transport system permease protein